VELEINQTEKHPVLKKPGPGTMQESFEIIDLTWMIIRPLVNSLLPYTSVVWQRFFFRKFLSAHPCCLTES
jgi:hypothetical protein